MWGLYWVETEFRKADGYRPKVIFFIAEIMHEMLS
jgi:hypothetical protein